MTNRGTYALSAMALIASVSVALADGRDDDRSDDDHRGGAEYEVEFITLNDSGVQAEMELYLRGNRLFVELEASGFEPGKLHPQHIHGHNDANLDATCPGSEADADGDGVVSVREGLPDYGPIVLPLVPFDLVDAEGNLQYEASFTVNPSTLQPLHKRAVVLHGMTVNGQYIPSLPVACGEIVRDD